MWERDVVGALAELKTFETDLVNQEAQKARTILRDFFSGSLGYANASGCALTMHGSLVYNDPKNLDADVTIVSDKLPSGVMRHFWKLQLELEDLWPWKGLTDMSFAIIEEMNKDDLHYDDLMLSLVLSSGLIYPENRQQVAIHEDYKNMALKILEENPALTTGVILALNSAIAVRKARRAST